MIEIVNLSLSDIDKFWELFTILISEGFDDYSPELKDYYLNFEYSKDKFKYWVRNNTRIIYVARINEKIVGFVIGNRVWGGIGAAIFLAVHKEHRSQGIGENLMKKYIAYCEENNGHKVELWTSSPDYYKKFDFKILCDRKKSYFGLDRVLMEKEIGKWDNSKIDFSVRSETSLIRKVLNKFL